VVSIERRAMGWVRDIVMQVLPCIDPIAKPIARAYWTRAHPSSRRVYDLGDSHAEIFASIYRQNLWGSRESRSGYGSTMPSTRSIRRRLPGLLRDLEVKTFLDAPCGDFNWMRRVDLGGVFYTGADIVPDLIFALQVGHSDSTHRFQLLDIVQGLIPTVDLWMCRELLMHLPTKYVFRVLENFHHSQSRYLLTTSFDLTSVNEDLLAPGFRPLNLQIPPIGLPQPILQFDDFAVPAQPRIMGLWSRDQVGGVLQSAPAETASGL
jgi:hypothetical protein